MIDSAMLAAIRHDIRAWPGGRSIHDDYEPDVFAPTTLAVVAELLDIPADHPLIARAQSPDWGTRDAQALLDLIADRLADAAHGSGADAFAARVRRVENARRSAKKRGEHLSAMQVVVFDAAEKLGLLDELFDDGTPAEIARALEKKYPDITASDVSKRIDAMKGKSSGSLERIRELRAKKP